MDFQKILSEIQQETEPLFGQGKAANYIPALSEVQPRQFGMAISTVEGERWSVGAADTRFSIQSISKVFALAAAFRIWGEQIWQRVGKEPSGNPFNSLVQLEYERGKPRNPFINAGALVICDQLLGKFPDLKTEMLDFVRKIARCNDINFNPEVVESEAKVGFTNAALANYLKSHGNLQHDVATVLDSYFHLCSLEMSCCELADAFLFFANRGKTPDGKQVLTLSQSKRLLAVMLTCGFYDEAGEFAFRVGLPGKSGVGGGIVAIIPGRMSVAVWSPEINRFGNSVLGMQALELFTTKTEISVF